MSRIIGKYGDGCCSFSLVIDLRFRQMAARVKGILARVVIQRERKPLVAEDTYKYISVCGSLVSVGPFELRRPLFYSLQPMLLPSR